ncbi:MAG: hypothetical protein AB8A39_06260 [Prochlorococcus sp.]|jgi:hypothetical protein
MTEFVPTKRQCKYVSEDGKYGLYEQDLYRLGEYGYLAGAVFGTDQGAFEVAIDAAEEEMRCLVAEARSEFGF